MKYFLALSILLSGMFSNAQAQINTGGNELGLYFDINGFSINNYCDFDYLPHDLLRVNFETDGKFIPGVYYDLDGRKFNCDIKQSSYSNEVYFKTGGMDELLLSVNNCSGYVVGLDSFIVISNFRVDNLWGSLIKKRDWAQVITKAKDYTIVENVRKEWLTSNFYKTRIIKTDTSSQLTSVFSNKTIIKFFGDFKAIKDAITEMKLGYYKTAAIAKHYDYKDKYEKNEKIYYSRSWDELKGPGNASYYAKITDLNGLMFELNFFDNANTLLYSGHFSSFAPIVKEGEFTWFYPDGTMRKKNKL